MSSEPRSRRSRSADAASSTSSAPEESVWDALNAGRDPCRGGITWVRADPSALHCCTCDAEGENRAYILTDKEQISRFFPSAVTRDKKNPLLVNWEFLKLLPAASYVLVFPLPTQGHFQALSEATYCLDGYQSQSGKVDDQERIAGFVNREGLRLLLYPDAVRFFWAGLHEPLLAEGAWPSARAVMQSGFVLRPGVRNALAARLATVAASAPTLHHIVRERHWPSQELATACLEADQQRDDVKSLLVDLPDEGPSISGELQKTLPFYMPMQREVKRMNRELAAQRKMQRVDDGMSTAADVSAPSAL